jgi:hypothetical protein
MNMGENEVREQSEWEKVHEESAKARSGTSLFDLFFQY